MAEVPPHSSQTKIITSADGTVTNIGFAEGDDYVDMEVTGKLTDNSEIKKKHRFERIK